MIQVNLLPPEKRPPEGTSPARLTVIIAGVLIPVLGLLLDLRYWNTTRILVSDTEDKVKANEELQKKIDEQQSKIREIEQIDKKILAISNLRENRMLWGRFHYRFFQMMTALDLQEKDRNVVVRRFALKRATGDSFTIDMGVEVLGNSKEDNFDRQGKFMQTVDRYSGGGFLADDNIVELAAKLQGLNPTPKPLGDTAGLKPIQIQQKLVEAKAAAMAEAVEKLKKEYRNNWMKSQKSNYPNEADLKAHVEKMLTDADELVMVNNFTGLLFEKIRFKQLEPTSVSIPTPKAGMEFLNMQTMCDKVDFGLSFKVGTLKDVKQKKK